MFIIIPGAFNAQVGVPGGGQQGQVVTVGSILRVIERDRRPYPTDVGTPSDIWIDNTSGIGYICKEFNTGHGTVWDRLDLLGDFVTFGDSDPGVNIDIKLGYRPGSLRYSRNSEILWICKDNTQGAAVWDVLSSGGSVVSVNGLTGVVQLYLDDLMDVRATTPTDGDVLTWDSASSTWIAAAGVGITYTANNGLTAAPGNIFQLGGTVSGTGNLIRDTYITNDNYIFRIDQTGTAKSALYLSHLGTGANYGVGLTVQVADGRSIRASSTGDVVFEGVSQADYTAELIRNTATTTGIEGILKLARGSSGVPAPDIGGSIDFWIKARTTTPFPGLNTAAPTEPTVRLVGLWENPGYAIMSRLSRFDIYGFKDNDTIKNASVTGNGKFTLYQYGQTPAAFLDTPVWSLGVNADGDVIEFDGGDGDTYTVDSGLSLQTGSTTNFQLGATTNVLSPLLHDTYINLDNYDLTINGKATSTYNLLIDDPGGVGIDALNSAITIDRASFNLQSTDITNNRIVGLDITTSFGGAASLRRTKPRIRPLLDLYNGFYVLGDDTGWNVNDGITQYQYKLPPAGTGYKAGALTDKNGDGVLSWETVSGGGSTGDIYYLNKSVPQGTISGIVFQEMNKIPVIGLGNDYPPFNTDGYIASFVTDPLDPSKLLIPAGNWNFEMWFSANNAGGSPRFYIEVYKLSGSTLTWIASNIANPEYITNGNVIDLYTTAVAMPATPLSASDRIAIRVYVIHSSKTITLHTEGPHLCEVITTFASSGGITELTGDVTTPAASSGVTAATLKDNLKKGSFGVTVDGISSTIQVGQTGFVTMPYDGVITGWSITTNAVGSIQFDVWKDASIYTIPTVADSIVGGVYPTLTTNQLATSTSVGAWTTAFSAGHVFGFYVNSVSSTVKNATLTIRCNKT